MRRTFKILAVLAAIALFGAATFSLAFGDPPNLSVGPQTGHSGAIGNANVGNGAPPPQSGVGANQRGSGNLWVNQPGSGNTVTPQPGSGNTMTPQAGSGNVWANKAGSGNLFVNQPGSGNQWVNQAGSGNQSPDLNRAASQAPKPASNPNGAKPPGAGG